MTREGYKQVEKELLKLYKETRPKIIADLRIAYDYGDLRENSEFDAARDAQNLCDARIRRLENLLNHALIVDNLDKNRITVGSVVTIEYLNDGELETFQIVSFLETNALGNKISDISPMGSALCGSAVNEIVEIASPNGNYMVKVVRIE